MADPPPPPFSKRFFKLPTIRPKPLQRRILEYLSDGERPGINAIATDLDIWRFSAQRCLWVMKKRGLVEDEWGWFAAGVVPGIKAHMWSIINQGRGELKFLQSVTEEREPYPLGYRILLFMSHGSLMTIGQIAKMVDTDRGHVKRVVQSLRNKGSVECLISSTRTASGWDATTHLYRMLDLGRQMLDAGPAAYVRTVRRPVQHASGL